MSEPKSEHEIPHKAQNTKDKQSSFKEAVTRFLEDLKAFDEVGLLTVGAVLDILTAAAEAGKITLPISVAAIKVKSNSNTYQLQFHKVTLEKFLEDQNKPKVVL